MMVSTAQIDISELLEIAFDAIICSSGYESRATYLYSKIKAESSLSIERRFCLLFNSHATAGARKKNDIFFKKNEFKLIPSSGNNPAHIINILEELIFLKKDIKILIDYSCMTRVWYASILNYIHSLSPEFTNLIELFFSYSDSKYIDPPSYKVYNGNVEPIDGFYSINTPHKPTALIIGLGYLEEQALGLAETFDSEPFLFINQTSEDDLYYSKVMQQNKMLIKEISDDHIFEYSISNLLYSETILYSLCKDLNPNYRIVLAPCGPKPFTLICLFISIRLNIDVWRISPGDNEVPLNKTPNGRIITYKVSFN